MKSHKVYLLTKILFLLSYTSINSQINFDNYKTLKAEGTIPKDFTTFSFDKIEEDLTKSENDLSLNKKKDFLKDIHYGIDELLHSGTVIFGDPVSLYTESIADKLLVNESELRSKLRFYTIKSNEINALSTDQGIIFVTTGLISQLINEAQLAFILAHEITHYKEKHVVERFELTHKKLNLKIQDLSSYSKENEFEADRLAIKWYNEAGYSKEELISTFDVLLYSYLPFEEIDFPISYFNSNNYKIPASSFYAEKFGIIAEENYDDELSSHPNIKKRKIKLEDEISKFSKWGNFQYLNEKEKFENIQNICRFETIRSNIQDFQYVKALYSIFILEQSFPNSIFLKQFKAQAWLGIANEKIKNKSWYYKKIENFEGEIGTLEYFISYCSKDELITLALRQVYDLMTSNTDNKQLNEIYKKLISKLTEDNDFKIERYSKNNYETERRNFEIEIEKNKIDTLNLQKLNKYENIKNKTKINNPIIFDSTLYYLYGISDIINNPIFIDIYQKEKSILEENNRKKIAENEKIEKLSKRKIKKIKNEEFRLGLEKLIVIEPKIYNYSKNGELNKIKSEKLKNDFSIAIENSAKNADISTIMIDKSHIESINTIEFNNRSVLFNYIYQFDDDNKCLFPVDFDILEEIKVMYGTTSILSTRVHHARKKIITPINLAGCIFIYWVPVYIPYLFFNAHDTHIYLDIYNLENGKVDLSFDYYFKDSVKKISLEGHMFDVFIKLKQKKM